jgi:glycosyltransferase involved in cell wall biosynthesis
MRIAIVALSSEGAMGHYLDCLASGLAPLAEVSVHCPQHTQLSLLSRQSGPRVRLFETGASKAQALARLLSVSSFHCVLAGILNDRPEIVHLLSGEGYPWALLLARNLHHHGIPLVTTVHDPRPHSRDVWGLLGSISRRFVLERSCCVHVHSRGQVGDLASTGVESSQIRVIPLGSFHELFPRVEPSPDRARVVLFWGRIEHYKGIDTFVRAAGLLDGHHIRFVIAGAGRIARSVAQAISGDQDAFELHNRYLTNAEIGQLLARSRVCVLPYRDATQSAIPLIAAWHGLRVVATSVGAFREDIPAIGGILVPPENPPELARAIVQALSGDPPRFPEDRTFRALAPRFLEVYTQCAHEISSSW